MKTTIKQLTAVALFAFLIVAGNANAKETELNASSHESIETILELEDWMVSADLWNTSTTLNLQLDTDSELVLENWMTSEETWKQENRIETKTETEETLAFEPWMTNEKVWNR